MIDYNTLIPQHIAALPSSGIRKFFDLLDNMKDVTALTVGQPDFVTPWHIREAAIESLERGKTYYTSNAGLMECRREIAAYMKRRFSLDYDPQNEILTTVGGSEAIDITVRALVTPGDEVIIPEPCFVCYAPIVTLAGGIPVRLPLTAKNKFKLTPEELAAVLTEKTKLLILAFPNNPTGAIMEKEELEAIAAMLRDTNIAVLSDEIYAELTYGKRHVSIASLEGMRERTVVVGGFSKAYAMTGWRLGYTLAPKEITRGMYKIHQYAIMCAPTQSQFAAIEALKNGDADIEEMKAEYDRRRHYILKGLEEIGLECFAPEGAFYVFPKIAGFGLSSEEFCEKLLYDYRVAIVPGTAFGECGEGFARISYAYSVPHITKALEGIGKFVKDLKESL
ncbi:MAG: aminotransferase class I/II-fold pyridoxal phosphate-dependent enzyme [Clostridia bacterium]|nr:aminotransferase class I/II-fold pyridoxal phosphate-dependent enzyme [Clostridia bacterium]